MVNTARWPGLPPLPTRGHGRDPSTAFHGVPPKITGSIPTGKQGTTGTAPLSLRIAFLILFFLFFFFPFPSKLRISPHSAGAPPRVFSCWRAAGLLTCWRCSSLSQVYLKWAP